MSITIYGLKLETHICEQQTEMKTPYLLLQKAIDKRSEDLTQQASTYQENGFLTYVTKLVVAFYHAYKYWEQNGL